MADASGRIDYLVNHCFFHRCAHVVTGWDSDEVHDEMEDHYVRDHGAQISSLIDRTETR